MQKMMTYSEANSVLGSSLTPANRCLSKAVAIANEADPDLLEGFDNARLVPASVIEPAAHAEVLHFFCDESGNDLGTNYTMDIPEGQGAYVFYTRILVNGQVPDTSWFDQKEWSDNPSAIHFLYPYPEGVGGLDASGSTDDFCYPGEVNSIGVLRHVGYGPNGGKDIILGTHNIPVKWSNSAKSAGIDINNDNTITLNVNPVTHSDYNISKTILYLFDKKLGYGESLTINGFDDFVVTRVPKDSKTTLNSNHRVDTSDWFTDFIVQDNKLTIYRIIDPRLTRNFKFNDVYKISDGNKTLYVRVSDRSYNKSWVQPGQEGDSVYEMRRISVNKEKKSPDPDSTANFFKISDAGSGKCSINTSFAGCYIVFTTENFISCPYKGRIIATHPTTGYIIGRTEWFLTEDEEDVFDKYHLRNNILKNSEVVSFIDTNVANGANLFLEVEENTELIPEQALILRIQPSGQ